VTDNARGWQELRELAAKAARDRGSHSYQSGKYLSGFEKEIMDTALEDYTQLGDVLAAVCNATPGKSEEKRLRVAPALVGRLLKRGYVCLYYEDCAASTLKKRVAREIPPEDHQKIIHDARNWAAYSADAPGGFAIAGTPGGEKAMYD